MLKLTEFKNIKEVPISMTYFVRIPLRQLHEIGSFLSIAFNSVRTKSLLASIRDIVIWNFVVSTSFKDYDFQTEVN